ncbi:MAG: peptidyl-prolyl cis-trans isomerase [Sphingomonadales bacterium]|jgi:peptidyl-prolyl cis-trans isomerase D|nr:peptidyl-prolyl cis-trans isomerase [Sphingomonadales bacterium]
MLAFARKRLTKWLGVALLGFVLIAMVATGFGTGGFGGLGSLSGGGTPGAGDTLATVEGKALSARDVGDMVNRQFSRARQQDPTLTMEAFLAQGAFEQVLDQMAMAAAVQAYARSQGLVVSPTMIDREIVNIPAFRNLTGQFDQAVYEQQLRTLNLSEARFREDVAQSLTQRQLLGPVALGARAPEGIAREYANLLLERRRGTIAVVPTALMAQGINPTPAELAAFYQANRIAFTTPERRVVKYAVIGADQVAQTARATDAEILAVYRNSPLSYGPRETRTIQSIVLPSQQAAQDFANRVRGGTDFVAAAAQAGFTAADVTFADQNRDQFARVANPQVAAAAFAAAQGAVAGPLRSDLGFHVVRVERITSVAARPIEAVRGEIAAAIEARKRLDALATLVSRIENQLADGGSIEEVARTEHLAIVTTPPVTATGQPGGDSQWVLPPELRPVLSAAFEIDPENPEPVVEQVVANERFAVLTIERAIPAAPPPLAQILPEVRAAFVQQRARTLARALADRIAGAINAGTPAARAFAEAQPRLPAGQQIDMRRLDISRSQQQAPPPPLIALFSIPQGRARVMPAPNNAGWFIVVHEQRTPGDAASNPQLIQSTRTQFSSGASEEIAQQFARAIEARSETSRDQEAIRRARATLGGGGAPTGR